MGGFDLTPELRMHMWLAILVGLAIAFFIWAAYVMFTRPRGEARHEGGTPEGLSTRSFIPVAVWMVLIGGGIFAVVFLIWSHFNPPTF